MGIDQLLKGKKEAFWNLTRTACAQMKKKRNKGKCVTSTAQRKRTMPAETGNGELWQGDTGAGGGRKGRLARHGWKKGHTPNMAVGAHGTLLRRVVKGDVDVASRAKFAQAVIAAVTRVPGAGVASAT